MSVSYLKSFLFNLKSTFFDLFLSSTFSLLLREIFFRLSNMTDSEKTPILVAVPITEEENTTRDCCTCHPCCKDKCAVFLIILLIISIIMFLVASAMYVASELTSPKVLCPDSITSIVKLVGYLFSFFAAVTFGIATCHCNKACDYCCNRCSGCSVSTMVILTCFFLVFLPLLICSMWLNFHGMNMIVQDLTDGAIYRCEGDQENPDAHRILFKFNNETTNHLNQGCDFWPINTLCDSLICAFKAFPSLVKMNGTLGAYRCSDSSPEGHDVCVSYLGVARIYSYIQTTLAYVSVVFLMILSIWIERRDQSDDCARCCDCCTPEGSRYKLIPQKVASVFEDKYFSI